MFALKTDVEISWKKNKKVNMKPAIRRYFSRKDNIAQFYPTSQKTASTSSGVNAKSFLLRSNVAKGYADGVRDFAPDEALGEETPGRARGGFIPLRRKPRVSFDMLRSLALRLRLKEMVGAAEP
jgi:hypothetical protein